MRRCSFLCLFLRVRTVMRSLYALFLHKGASGHKRRASFLLFFFSSRLPFRQFCGKFTTREPTSHTKTNNPKKSRLAPQINSMFIPSFRDLRWVFHDNKRHARHSPVLAIIQQTPYTAPAMRSERTVRNFGKEMHRRDTRPSSFYARLCTVLFFNCIAQRRVNKKYLYLP